jgi:DNA-binding transcriptional MerR regulator
MRIGEVAKRTGVSIRAIRHYDSVGLLRANRDENGYRSFTAEDVERVRLIQTFLSVGFRLEEIRDHAPCWRAGSPASLRDVSREQSKSFLERKVLELDERIHTLDSIRSRLKNQLQTYAVHAEPAQGSPNPEPSKKTARRKSCVCNS